MSIIITILILGIIIFVHELGHFATAKFFKMPVSEFAIGMGPKIWGTKRGSTVYNLRAIPFGGFVNIEGMEIGDTRPDGFNNKKPFQRFVVLFAGVFMNFVLAWMIMVTMFYALGEYKIGANSIIGDVDIESYAYKVILPDDKIISIDGKLVSTWDEVVTVLGKKETEKVLLLIERNNEKIAIETKMRQYNEDGKYRLGITPKRTKVVYNFTGAVLRTNETLIGIIKAIIIKQPEMIAKGEITRKDVAGPIGLHKYVKMFMEMGPEAVLFLAAILSVSVGVFNLLPFPALDGGRILFVILEMLGVKINKQLEEKIHRVGLIFLFGVMILIMGNDIVNLFQK